MERGHSSIRGVPDTPEPHADETPVGRHALGPHVVGQRIVVRHLLPDGRASDVLGTCTRWGEHSLTIDRDGGPDRAVRSTIALADVVTGKPVPPRASVRSRVSAPARSRCTSGALWSEVEPEPLGEWVAARLSAARRPAAQARQLGPGDGRPGRRVDGRRPAGPSVLRRTRAGAAWPRSSATVEVEQATAPRWVGRPSGAGDSDAQLAAVAARAAGTAARRTRRDGRGRRDRTTGSPCRLLDGRGDRAGRAVDGDWLLPSRGSRSSRRTVVEGLGDGRASPSSSTGAPRAERRRRAARGERQRRRRCALYERLGFVTHHTNRYLAAALTRREELLRAR